MKRNALIAVLIAVLLLLGISIADAGQRRAKTSPIYNYPGGPQPVRPSHCHRVLVTYEQDVLYTSCHPFYGCYQWIGTRRFQRIETRCHPSHGRYHIQED